MTIQPNRALTTKASTTPAKPAPKAPAAATEAKAQSSKGPNELINRRWVAEALDRPGSLDGVISAEEFSQAGIRLDADAKEIINRGGESGEAITVNELAKALGSDAVAITGEGRVSVKNGFATLTNGRIEKGQTWSFPDIPGLRTLQDVKEIAPGGVFSYYNPDSPAAEFTYTKTERVGSYQSGDTLGYNEFVGDASGRRLSPDANGKYPAGSYVWAENRYTDYGRLGDVLEAKAQAIRAITRSSTDPEIQHINRQVSNVLSRGWFSSDRQKAYDLYNTLSYIDTVSVPTSPRTRMNSVDSALTTANSRLDEQFRIVKQIPVEAAREAVGYEVDRLSGGATVAKMVGGGLGAVAGGVGGFFALGSALAGAPLIAAAAGIGLVAAGAGWFIGKLINDGKAKGLKKDLEVLQSITPEANKKELQQYAVVGYKLLQDARTVNTLARLRAYDEDASSTHRSITGSTSKIESQTRSLRNMEALVQKYAQ